MDRILEVKKLKVSFRTASGTLKAVRDISFDLERGKTFAIVGESGSGKSVTSKAILGILAGNSIVEGGEILYDGKDLLKLSEEELYKLRGDKISMIFQDPLSSLNPIVKIGKQITEAMLLKNKANRRLAKKEFNGILAILKENMIQASIEKKEKVAELIDIFDRFCIEANRLEQDYNEVISLSKKLLSDLEDFLFLVSKKQKVDTKRFLSELLRNLPKIKNTFIPAEYEKQLIAIDGKLRAVTKKNELNKELRESLEELEEVLKKLTKDAGPDFFRIGYYKLKNPGVDFRKFSRDELNKMTLSYLDENFMKEFLALEQTGIEYSYKKALENKKKLLLRLEEAKEFFQGELNKAEALKYAKQLSREVEASIDYLEIKKDNTAYTFSTSLESSIQQYFYFVQENPREEKRFERQSKKRQRLLDKGKTVDWIVVPKTTADLLALKENILQVITHLEEQYKAYIAHPIVDFEARSIEVVDYLKKKASQVVYKLTKAMAKEQALKLMEEVGIHEPRRRYYQYPFEFSGGMRQRIVIAIALAANPDILICDEPTTALDVTMQAQILELINKLKEERGLSVIFITHDLGVVANMADSIAVMYAGKIVEYGTVEDIFYDPRHPYTWALLSSMPDLDTDEKLDAIPGTPPNMIYPPVGDAFAARNKYAMEIDFEMQPPMFRITDSHFAATWLLHPDAPKVEMPDIIRRRIEKMKKLGGESCEES